MKSIVKTIMACFVLKAMFLVMGGNTVSAQALYNNSDTIQKYLKERIAETKEQLKETRSKLKEFSTATSKNRVPKHRGTG